MSVEPYGVDRWDIPPECQGQIVEVSYGLDEDGLPWRRTVDRSSGDVAYSLLSDQPPELWEPWNCSPDLTSRKEE